MSCGGRAPIGAFCVLSSACRPGSRRRCRSSASSLESTSTALGISHGARGTRVLDDFLPSTRERQHCTRGPPTRARLRRARGAELKSQEPASFAIRLAASADAAPDCERIASCPLRASVLPLGDDRSSRRSAATATTWTAPAAAPGATSTRDVGRPIGRNPSLTLFLHAVEAWLLAAFTIADRSGSSRRASPIVVVCAGAPGLGAALRADARHPCFNRPYDLARMNAMRVTFRATDSTRRMGFGGMCTDRCGAPWARGQSSSRVCVRARVRTFTSPNISPDGRCDRLVRRRMESSSADAVATPTSK